MGNQNGRRVGGGAGLIVALILAAFTLFQYYGSSTKNPVTGQTQHVAGVTANQEIALGLQAAPEMVQQYGGEVNPNSRDGQIVQRVGQRVLAGSAAAKTGYKFQFHLLGDEKTINAFALPGGQVFITEALLHQLTTEGQVAGVLGHEVGHVVARHGAQHIAKQQLTQGLTGAAVMASYDPNDPAKSTRNAAVIAAVGQLVNLKYGRNDELEADKLGVRFMSEAGYDPRAMVGVMQVLAKAGGGKRTPEFFSTHPNPENRIPKIQDAIKALYPQGVPSGLTP